MNEAANKYLIPNLDRALSVLEVLSNSTHGLGVSDIAQRVHIPKNSAFRILYTLLQRGYVEQISDSKLYRLSCQLLSLGHRAVDDSTILERAIPSMYDLRNMVNETVLLGILYNDGGVVLEQVPGNNLIRCTIPLGYRFSLQTTAPGKVFLAWMPHSQRDQYIAKIKFKKYTETTITNRADLLKELEKVRKQGYAFDLGEELQELRCVAAPIFDNRSNLVATIWVNAPAFRVNEKDLINMSRQVRQTADEISIRLGWKNMSLND